MGSGGSKEAGAPPMEVHGGAGSAGGGGGGGRGGERCGRWLRSGVLASACFCLPSSATASDCERHKKRRQVLRFLRSNSCAGETVVRSHRGRGGCCLKFKVPLPGQATYSGSPCSGLDGGCQAQEGTLHADPGDGSGASTETATINWTSNSLNRSHSHFGFFSDEIASRLDRAASLGSPGAQSSFPGSYSIQNPEGDGRVNKDSNGSLDSRNGTGEDNLAADNVSSQGIIGRNMDTGAGISGSSDRSLVRTGDFERRHNTRHRPQEPVQGSIRFSRTLSVGRLRDRVLRGPSFSDRFFGSTSLEDRPVEYHANGTEQRDLRQALRRVVSSENSTDVVSASTSSHPTSMSSSMDNRQNHVSETPQLREVTNRDILEHRSAFIERRRRIRSQVQALQQLGNRVENFPGHDRSCILSGQHRTGHCPCRQNSRPPNHGGGRNSRSSISRIVMLAEALFEVLDEIHQQAVVLASRPSVSSIGSVPAPREVVERMPLRIFQRAQKHHNKEAAQCYICLVEYEEGDYVRTLPCHHEFHRICIDKWLKEIHRVCPLCRGDVCISDLPSIS